ncbi:hypothetical protein CHLNCDRAFT_140305 [Chlorella variabilis]|uniref:Uncharacterized protein n=1 Tax=Chlorella variabilis TaxID=554065 RepID=E1Z6Q6_CHLVA|nr:hypothetical protein CHLNCDRAFT_140305 [Chlorella variabilis]EFN58691.1 hypothetical protein CHLNCDRAFT_140305 [Chlorella variabilis]|eukprot:XP_005850793.1 hypothetical protein CHLNCDRAFT_140305 [Chlorella variabilis]
MPAPTAVQQLMQAGETSLDQEMNAAWRWRFTRKWQAEQMKQFEPPAPPGANGGLAEGEDEEEWTAALRLMDTVDGGLNMQIGRTLSLHNSSMVGGSGMSVDQSLDQSLNLMSPGLSQCVLLDGSIKESPLREEAVAATTQIVSVARKAQHLRRQQQEIERKVSERWEAASSGDVWVAQHLPAVQLDSWSSFSFVLVRLSEQRSQRQKLLVRGRNGATEQQAFASAEQEAARVAVSHRLPGPRVELVASGRMEWVAASDDQRRSLRIRASRLLPPAAKDARLHSTAGNII